MSLGSSGFVFYNIKLGKDGKSCYAACSSAFIYRGTPGHTVTYGDRTRGATTKADGAYLEMRNQILLGTLEPGSRVDYVQLSASLGVSITPLREALRRLEADHLVIRNAHRDVGASCKRCSRSLEARRLPKLKESIRKCSDIVKDFFTDETHRVDRTLSGVGVSCPAGIDQYDGVSSRGRHRKMSTELSERTAVARLVTAGPKIRVFRTP